MYSINEIINLVYLILTFFYTSLITMLFLEIHPSKKVICSFSLFSIVSILLQYYFLQFLAPEDVELCFAFLVHLPLLLLCWLLYRKSPIASMAALFLAYFCICPRYVLGVCIAWLFPSLPNAEFSGRIIVTLPLLLLIVFTAVKPIRRVLNRSKKDVLLFSFPLITIYVLSFLLVAVQPIIHKNPQFIGKTMLTLFVGFFIYYIRIYFYTYDEKNQLEHQQHIINMSESAIRQQLKQMELANEKTKAMRHDLRHFCNIIHCYADDGNLDKIKEYIDEIQSRTYSTTIKTYCKNPVINLLLSSYLEPFLTHDVPITTEIDVPEDIFVADIDLCIILANTLENAYKACQYEDHPFLNLKLRTSPERLFYQVQNSASGTITFADGCPTSHVVGHGVGTKSIALIANKYHGLYDFHQSDNIFSAKIILHSPVE